MNKVITKIGIGALAGTLLLSGVTGCVRRRDVETSATTETVGVEIANTEVRSWCEAAGETYFNGILKGTVNEIFPVVDTKNNPNIESVLYTYFDGVNKETWSYDFYRNIISKTQFVAAGFNYDAATATAQVEYRITIPDYQGTSADGELKYTLSLNFSYDSTNKVAVITNPAVVIDEYFRVAERDYVNYILADGDETLPAATIDETEPSVTATPTPTPTVETTKPSVDPTATETSVQPGPIDPEWSDDTGLE